MLLLKEFPSVSGKPAPVPHFRFDSGFIFAFQGGFQRAQRRLDSGLSSATAVYRLLLQPAYGCCAADGHRLQV